MPPKTNQCKYAAKSDTIEQCQERATTRIGGVKLCKEHGDRNPKLGREKQALCTWKLDEDGNYWTSCDHGFILNDGTPTENSMKYCCYCGGEIKEAKAEALPTEHGSPCLNEAPSKVCERCRVGTLDTFSDGVNICWECESEALEFI